jgi:hypothetical protein
MKNARESLVVLLFLAVAAVHLVPGGVAFAPGRAADLYGVSLEGDAMVLLMRHRALLLAIVGVLLAVAAFVRSWRAPATVAGLLSMGTFVLLYAMAGTEMAKLARIAAIDGGAMVLLVVAGLLGRERRK